MNPEKLRGWWFARQGLGESPSRSPQEILERYGWARSVGGVNPYLALRARGAGDRASIDAALERGQINELPSARSCTYVLPETHYALGLQVGTAVSGESQDLKTARKYFDFTDEEMLRLQQAVLESLESGPLEPREIKARIGDAARSLGEEGKKRGMTTTLPMALGVLQGEGRIRRIPVDGRLDGQRFRYARWSPSPLESARLEEDALFTRFAELYFRWIGPASLKQFQWFSGLTLSKAKAAVAGLPLSPLTEDSDLLLLDEDREAFQKFVPSEKEQVVLVGSIDPLFHLRRDILSHLDLDDQDQQMQGDRALYKIGAVEDLTHHAIVDRGRIVGLWEYDPNSAEIVWRTFRPSTPAIREAVAAMQEFVRDQLGDARSFSLDSAASRKPKLEFLRSG